MHWGLQIAGRQAGIASNIAKGQRKQINFFNTNFWRPTQNAPFRTPRKNYVPHFLGRSQNRDPHQFFFGGVLGQKRGAKKCRREKKTSGQQDTRRQFLESGNPLSDRKFPPKLFTVGTKIYCLPKKDCPPEIDFLN